MAFSGRRAVETYLDELNRVSPIAERRILSGGAADSHRLAVGAVANTIDPAAPEIFLGECRFDFSLDMVTRSPAAAGAHYAIGLPLAGSLAVTASGRHIVAQAGEGVIVDPADVERTHIPAGAHFVEFHLGHGELQRLAAQWAPGLDGRLPRFSPHLAAPLAQRLLFMAAQASAALESDGSRVGSRMLFRRWTEMIALTLLDEQSLDNALAARQGAGRSAPAPASVRRAVDYIQAHAGSDIGLADVAQAACTSVSSLLRHFQAHVGDSPAAYLRRVRLERARAELQAAGAPAIREVALRWGFQNASKFSTAYAARFGERPSDSRGRAAIAPP